MSLRGFLGSLLMLIGGLVMLLSGGCIIWGILEYASTSMSYGGFGSFVRNMDMVLLFGGIPFFIASLIFSSGRHLCLGNTGYINVKPRKISKVGKIIYLLCAALGAYLLLKGLFWVTIILRMAFSGNSHAFMMLLSTLPRLLFGVALIVIAKRALDSSSKDERLEEGENP